MDNDNKPRALERRVFREDIREQLIDDILSGKLPPGARIVETRIAQQFGVSQGPVREALRDLELFGFVVSSPFRGTQVRQISKADLLEIYPIRAALESVAARAAATKIDDATLDRLDELIATMREAASNNNAKAQADADHAFHAAIIKAAGNRMLEHVWQTMRSVDHDVRHARGDPPIAARDRRAAHGRSRCVARARSRARGIAIRRHIEEPGEWILAADTESRAAAERAMGEKEAAG